MAPPVPAGAAAPPLLVVIAIQAASVFGDSLAQRCQQVHYRRSRTHMLLGLTTASAVQVLVLLALAQALLPAAVTGAVYEGRELKRCCLGRAGPVPRAVRECEAVPCPPQGPRALPSVLARHPLLLLNGLLNIVYYVAEVELYRSPLGLVLIVCSALSSTFLLDPVARAFGLEGARPLPLSVLALGFVGCLACVVELPPPAAAAGPPARRRSPGGPGAREKASGDEAAPERCEHPSPRVGVPDSVHQRAAAAGGHGEREVAGPAKAAAEDEAGRGSKGPATPPPPGESPLRLLAPFAALSASYCLWFVTQKYFHDDYGLNAWGYTALDQGLLPLYIVPFLALARAWPPLAAAIGASPGEGVGELARATWRETRLLDVMLYRLLANGRAVCYFYLIVLYDMGAVYVQLTLVRVLLSWLVSLAVCVLAPGFVGTTAAERAAVLAPRAIALKLAGSALILAGLLTMPR